MDTLRVDNNTVAPPPLESPAARPAPAPRPRAERKDEGSGPESAPLPSKSSEGSEVLDASALRGAVEELGSELNTISAHSLEITFEEEDSRYVVQVRDKESGEIVRQIPPETLLEANRQLSNLRGLLFDDRS